MILFSASSCGGYHYGKGGNFTSPNYPKPYGDSRDCTWIIEVPESYRVELKFHAFDLEDGFDYVNVRDGKTLNSKSFGLFNGNKKPPVLTSSSNFLRVTLISDASDSFSGFFAEYKAGTASFI